MYKTNKIFEKCLALVDPKISAEVRAKADAYIGHPYEFGEGAGITSQREAYIQGAAEQELITKREMIEKAKLWAEQQNFSVSVQLDLVKFLEGHD